MRIHCAVAKAGPRRQLLRQSLLPWSVYPVDVPDAGGQKQPIEELSGCQWGARTTMQANPEIPPGPRAEEGKGCACPALPCLPAPRCPYFERAVLGTQLLLELGDLAGRVLPQLGEAGLESLHVLYQLGNLPLFGGQLNFEAGSGQHLYGLLLGRRKEMTKLHQLQTGAWG